MFYVIGIILQNIILQKKKNIKNKKLIEKGEEDDNIITIGEDDNEISNNSYDVFSLDSPLINNKNHIENVINLEDEEDKISFIDISNYKISKIIIVNSNFNDKENSATKNNNINESFNKPIKSNFLCKKIISRNEIFIEFSLYCNFKWR